MFVVFDKIESSDSSIVLTRFECLKIASKFERLSSSNLTIAFLTTELRVHP